MTPLDLLGRVERAERRAAELYSQLRACHAWDAEVDTVLRQLQREEQVHVKLIQHAARMAEGCPALLRPEPLAPSAVLACCRQLDGLHLPDHLSASEAIAVALSIEEAMEDASLCSRIGEALPFLVELLTDMQQPAHSAGLQALASRRAIPPSPQPHEEPHGQDLLQPVR